MRRFGWLAVAWFVLASCGDTATLGLSGCQGDEAPFASTPTNTVPAATHATLTAAGVDFLIESREALVGLLLAVDPSGWVSLSLPALDLGRQGGGLGVGVRDVVLGFDLRTVDLGLAFLPDPTRLRLTVSDARLRLTDGIVWVSVGGDAACRLGNGLAAGTPDAALVHVDFAVDVVLAVDDTGRLQAQVEVLPFTLRALDFELVYDAALPECADGSGAAECRLACGVGDAAIELGEALRDALDSQLDQLFQPVVQFLVDSLVGGLTQQPLAAEGRIHPRIIEQWLPTAADALAMQFKVAPSPAGLTLRAAGADGDGLGLTLDVGLDSLDHPCVPVVAPPPPLRAGPAPVLSGYDHTGAPYQVGLALSAAVVNRAVWTAYRAGALCAALDTDQIEALTGQRIDTGTLSLVVPGLDDLTLGPRPIRVALDPRFEASDLPLAEFFAVPDDGGVPQAGIRLRLPRLGLSFYGLVEERWTRLFAADADLALDVVVQATPDDRLLLTVARPQVLALTETYNELLTGADLPALLDLITDLATSVLLRDGLTLDVGLSGLVTRLTGLPFELGVAALRVEGEAGDFLSVLLRLGPSGASALRGHVETHAAVTHAEPGRVVLAVSADGAPAARYQWQVVPGPWRPLTAAPDGTLVVDDGRLRALGTHTLAVRAVAEGDYRSLDPTPAQVAVTVGPATRRAAAPRAAAGGCQAAPGGTSGAWGLWLLALWPLWRRRRLGRGLMGWVGCLWLLGGCGEPPAAAALDCARSADCPGGLFCLGGRCQRPDPCDESGDCCPGAVCRGGVCLSPEAECETAADCVLADRICDGGRCTPPPCDGGCPAQTRCLAGLCHGGPPCRAACDTDEACFAALAVCRPAPAACDRTCGPGEVRVVSPEAVDPGPLCDHSDAPCLCVTAPPLVPADYGRHASMALINGEPVFAAWDADYGDLVYVTGVEAGRPQITYLDGVPDGAVAADPAGPRGGVVAPGPDRGRYASLAVDGKGRSHIAYYDADAGALRYLRQTDDRAGWHPPVVLDDDGDVGRYPVMAVDTRDRPRVLYHVTRSGAARAGVRLAYSDTEAPAAADWIVTDLVSRPAASASVAPPGVTPREPGVMPCMRVGVDGRVHAAWYDGTRGWLQLARGRPGEAFEVADARGVFESGAGGDPGERYARFETHDLGLFCDLVYAPESDDVRVVFMDATTDALLMYRGPVLGGGVFEPVDDGGVGQRRLVGADAALALTVDGRAVVVYQDATANDLRLTVRGPGGWDPRPVVAAGVDAAVGFYNSLVLVGGRAVIGTLGMRTLPDGRGSHRLQVLRSVY